MRTKYFPYVNAIWLFSYIILVGALPGSPRLRGAQRLQLQETNLVSVVPADDVSKYSTAYFLDNYLSRPVADSCLFYTAHLTSDAQKYSKSILPTLTTIWDVWPCSFYSNSSAPDNPLRTIMSEPYTRLTYFENMSRAFAELCDQSVLLLTHDPGHIPPGGIWARIEEPALKSSGNPGGRVDEISACTGSCARRMSLWQRFWWQSSSRQHPGLRKRADTVALGVMKKEKEVRDKPARLKKHHEPQRRELDAVMSRTGYCYSPDFLQEVYGDIVW